MIDTPDSAPASTISFDPSPWLAAGFGLVGGFLRLRFFMLDRSLWIDEAMLAVNIRARPFVASVAQPLDFEQVAPPGFVSLTWATARAFGDSEMVLRLASLLAGLILLAATWALVRSMVGPWAAAVAVGLVSFAPYLVRYSAELKPYAFDALACCLIVFLAARMIRLGSDRRLAAWLFVTGVVSVLLSVPSLFVLGGAWLALASSREFRSGHAGLRWLAASAVTWVGLFVLLYVGLYRPATQSDYMDRFWGEACMSFDPAVSFQLHRNWTLATLFGGESMLPPKSGTLISLLAMFGLFRVARAHGSAVFILLAAPIALAYGASVIRLYPIELRLMLFSVPPLVVMLTAGLEGVWRLAPSGGVRLGLMVAALLILVPGVEAAPRGPQYRPEHSRPVLQDPAFVPQADEPVYVFARALPAWMLYHIDWDSIPEDHVEGLLALGKEIGPNSGNAPKRNRPVRDEGFELQLDDAQGLLLLGVPSGYVREYARDGIGSPRSVDPEWQNNEEARMRAATDGCTWVFMSHFLDVDGKRWKRDCSDPDGRGLGAGKSQGRCLRVSAAGIAERVRTGRGWAAQPGRALGSRDLRSSPLRQAVTEAAATAGAPIERIEAVVNAFFEVLEGSPDLPHFMLQEVAQGTEPARPILLTMRRVLGSVADVIRQGQEDGSMRDGDPALTAISIVAQPVHLTLVRRHLIMAAALDLEDASVRESVRRHVLRFVWAALLDSR